MKSNKSRKVLMGAATVAVAAMGAGYKDAHAVTAGVDVQARIINAIVVNSVQSLDFGSMTVAPATTGKVTCDHTGARAAGGAGGVSLVGGVACQNGIFSIEAETGVAYNVTVGGTAQLDDGGGNTITVSVFTFGGNPGTQTGLTNAAATESYNFGGTLQIPGGQTPGTYTGQVTVTANYQ